MVHEELHSICDTVKQLAAVGQMLALTHKQASDEFQKNKVLRNQLNRSEKEQRCLKRQLQFFEDDVNEGALCAKAAQLENSESK